MEFSLTWLAEYVELPLGGALRTGAAGRRRLGHIDDVLRREAFQLGEKLTGVGLAVEAIVERGQDIVFDVEVTSNRPDCMCHVGLARELAVALGQPLRRPTVPFYGSFLADGSSGSVILEDPEGCQRFVSRVIRGIRVGPSPEWLKERLSAIGLRSINNVVDATNFVLWELGQPLHAYDLATVPGGELRVRRARAGERLVTLDGVERELDPEVLVIADRARAVGVAGVMGGRDSEVTAATTDLLLESAHFDRRRVRIGAKRLGLHTDASHRFERGADFELCDEASRRAAALIVELAGGAVDESATDAVAHRPMPVGWRLGARELERFAGCAVADAEIERVLAGLGFAPSLVGERSWTGEVPSWRAVDFEPRRGPEPVAAPTAYPQDLFEEVLRHVGLDRVPATLPALGGVDAGTSEVHDLRARLQDALAALGFAEAIHFAFHEAAADARLPVPVAAGEPVALANPLSERYAVLRRSLVPNLVAAAEFNAHRGAAAVRLFEVGRLFPGGDAPELEALAVVAGGAGGARWDRRPAFDLHALKGVLESLFAAVGAAPPPVRAAELPGIVAGTGAEWRTPAGEPVGWLGRVAGADLPFELYAGEVLIERLGARPAGGRVVPPSRLPGVEADLTLTHSLAVPWAELEAAVRAAAPDLLVGFRLEDRYQGEGVPAGAVATTIRFEYHGGDRTLTQEEVNERQRALAAALENRFGIAGEGR